MKKLSFAKIGPIQQRVCHFYKEGSKGMFPYIGCFHTHLLYITVYIQQFTNSRDVEFLEWDAYLRDNIFPKVFENYRYNATDKSCEDFADLIYEAINLKDRIIKIEVLEDNGNGCIEEYNSIIH